MKNKKKLLIIGASIIIFVIAISLLIFFSLAKSSKSEVIQTVSNIEEAGSENTDEVLNVILENKKEETSNEILDVETEEDKAEIMAEEKKAKQNQSNNTAISSKSNFYIKVNYIANVVTVYKNDGTGNFIPYKALTCSTGRATPRSGVYSVKTKWTWGALFGNVYGHYVTKIVGNILFHSVPYLSQNPASLEYWEYDKLRNFCFRWLCKTFCYRFKMDL